MKLRNMGLIFLATLICWVSTAYSVESWLVSSSPTGLVYTGYANQNQANAVNKIPDFSTVGYQGGGVPIPFVPAKVTVSPSGGDDTAAIQAAINTVSAMSIGPDGFRGAVLLEAGEYTVSSTLNISKSGVVVRGAGSQKNGGTKITYTATQQSNVFSISGGSGPSEVGGTRVGISDSFVPVGATSFQVSNASGFSPGDLIMVQIMVNQKWLDDLSDMSQYGWTTSSYQLTWPRVITAVNGNTISIDAPIVQTIEDQYGGGDVYKYRESLLENVGIEALRMESTYVHIADEEHGKYAVSISRLQNGWVRQVTAVHFVQGTVSVSGSSQKITVEDCAALDHISMISGGRRYSFNINDSQKVLFQRCLTREGRHDYVSGSRTPGPNVFVDCRADNTHSDIGPHHRYATGQIYDNIMGGAMGAYNHRSGGSGHGWAGAQILYWNCDADTLKVSAPNGAMNWCIGSSGTKLSDGAEPYGFWESQNTPVTPRSLYYTQLTERLGTNALNSVVLPKQKTGTIWAELHEWGGDGLFLNDLIVVADEETIPAVGESLSIRGIVRNLTMLDNGATASWRKVYGPGTASFADDSALETTVSFTQNGSYLLELSVIDGSSVIKDAVIVQVGTGGADTTPPAAPTSLSATDNESSVSLNWADGTEPDLAGYDVFRSTVSGDVGTALAYGLTASSYEDLTTEKGILYYYTVRAVDENSNVSAQSAEVSAMVNALPTVEFTQPQDGWNYNNGSSIHVIVDANDKGGTIDNVELFLDGQSLGQDSSSPYGWSSEPLLQSMAVGTYVLKAIATDDQGASSTNSISFAVSVDSSPPAAPTGLQATEDYGWVSLDWADNTERDLAGYRIFRSTAPGIYGAARTNVTESNYDDMEVVDGTPYYYTVTAIDSNGFESVVSDEVFATPKMPPPGMVVFGSNSDGLGGFTHTTESSTQIWSINKGSVQYRNQSTETANASLLKGYVLDRSDGQSYTIEGVISLTDGYPEDNNRVGLYLFGDSAQIPGDSEAGALYIQRNFEGDQFSIYEGIQRTFIASETHGRAKDFAWFGEDLKISVDITFNGSNIDIVATMTDGQGDSTTVSTSVPSASYTGDYFGFATRSRTREFGIEGAIKSAPFTMDYQSLWVAEADDTAPATPTGLEAIAGDRQVSLDWNDNIESDLSTYNVYRSTSEGSYQEALATGLSASSYIDYSAENNTLYYYVVTASDHHANESVTSTEMSAAPTNLSDTDPPAQPSGLEAIAGDGSVALDWSDNGESDLLGYRVYRSTTSNSYGSALVTDLPASAYTDNSVFNDTTYYYVVKAVDFNGNESVQSDQVSAAPAAGLAFSDETLFGSGFDGLDGFTQSAPVTENTTWVTQANSVRYRNQDAGTQNSSFLKAFTLDRTPGNSYTISGTVLWSNGYADDNNRMGILLFSSTSSELNEDSTGNIGIIWNTDDSSAGGSPGNNSADDLRTVTGGYNANVADETLRTQTIPYAQDLVGTEVTFSAQIAFVGDNIEITASMTDAGGITTAAETIVVAAADYTGDYFGFVTRARARNYTGTGDSAEGRSLPWVMDYKSFSVAGSSSGEDTTAPAAPSGLTANADDGSVSLDWNDNVERDHRVYVVYRSTVSGTDYVVLTNGLISSSYMDGTVENGTTYYYVVTAIDANRNESMQSEEVSAQPEELVGYDKWAFENGVEGAGPDVDSDGDGIKNLYEYALGGNPTDGQKPAMLPVFSRSGAGFVYVYPKRSDDDALVYVVEASTNLLTGPWVSLAPDGVSTGNPLNFVTNRIDTIEAGTYIRLRIEE